MANVPDHGHYHSSFVVLIMILFFLFACFLHEAAIIYYVIGVEPIFKTLGHDL